EGDDDGEDVERLVALARFVPREAFPAHTVAVRQSLGRRFTDRLDRLPARMTRRRSGLDRSRRIQVVARDLVAPLLLLELPERRQRHHLPRLVLDEDLSQVLGHTPELRPRLHVHLVELVEQDEALLVRAPDQDIEVLERGRDRYTLLHPDVVVDDELVLWIVGGVEREDRSEE